MKLYIARYRPAMVRIGCEGRPGVADAWRTVLAQTTGDAGVHTQLLESVREVLATFVYLQALHAGGDEHYFAPCSVASGGRATAVVWKYMIHIHNIYSWHPPPLPVFSRRFGFLHSFYPSLLFPILRLDTRRASGLRCHTVDGTD